MKSNFLVVSTSLNQDSKSRMMAKIAYDNLKRLADKTEVDWLDLQEVELPICDGGPAYEHPNLPAVKEQIEKADGIIVAIPIYNYASGAMAKNLIELTGRAWTDKTVGFLCAAGGKSSYMSVMSLANSLMLDFRSLIIPSFVYADGNAFDETDGITDEAVRERIEKLSRELIRISNSLKTAA